MRTKSCPQLEKQPTPTSWSRRSSAPGPARCATSSPPSSPNRTASYRAGLDQSLCVQGAPGTGKTAIGLHRAAYLLYAFRDQLSRSGVLVVGPNDSFLSYIADVLPALGEIDAAQTTVTALVSQADGVTVRGFDSVPAALVKGDARMAEVLHRAVWSHLALPLHRWWSREGPTSGGSVRTWQPRSSTHYVDAVCATRLGEPCCGSGWLTRYCCGWRRAVTPLDDRRRRCRQAGPGVCGSIWPALDPIKLIMKLLTDPDFLGAAAEGVLGPEEQQLIMTNNPRRSVATARWSLADVILIDEAADLLQRTPSRGHVIVDEAQDPSPMMSRAGTPGYTVR